MTAKYKYLGRRVKDRGQKGLDSAREFYDIIKAILRDYKAGRITGRRHGEGCFYCTGFRLRRTIQRFAICLIQRFRGLEGG